MSAHDAGESAVDAPDLPIAPGAFWDVGFVGLIRRCRGCGHWASLCRAGLRPFPVADDGIRRGISGVAATRRRRLRGGGGREVAGEQTQGGDQSVLDQVEQLGRSRRLVMTSRLTAGAG